MWWMMTDGYYRLGAIACFREEDIAALAAKQRVTGRTEPVGSALDTTTILGDLQPTNHTNRLRAGDDRNKVGGIPVSWNLV